MLLCSAAAVNKLHRQREFLDHTDSHHHADFIYIAMNFIRDYLAAISIHKSIGQ